MKIYRKIFIRPCGIFTLIIIFMYNLKNVTGYFRSNYKCDNIHQSHSSLDLQSPLQFNKNISCANRNIKELRYIGKFIDNEKNNVMTLLESANNFLYFWSNFPKYFIPVNSQNELCKNQSLYLQERLKHLDIWAFKMYDATSKFPSGLLSGNINQYGDFDECLSIEGPGDNINLQEKNSKIQGKYCLAYLDIRFKGKNTNLLKINSLMHAHYAFRSTFDDVGHRIPRFSSINWGICMPSGCEAEDLQEEIASTFKRSLRNVTEISVDVRVESAMCKTKNRDNVGKSFSIGEIITWILFSLLIFLTITASLREFLVQNVNDDDKSMQRSENSFLQYLNVFSIQKNIETLLQTDKKEEIRIIDGARFLNALGLIISHKSMALLYNPYINRTAMSETLGMSWSIIGRTAIIYTETFIFLSGLLTANSFINDLKKTGRINFKDKLISRLFRITPNLITIILFCTYILPKMGSGPMWPLVIEEHSHLCKKYMWRNLLYIHNYFGFENMCLTHTHQVGIDMQLFFICPLIIYAIWYKPKLGTILLIIIGIWSTLLRFWITYSHKLSTVIYFGMSVGQLFDTANYSYTLPTHRATVYGMGIMMAFLLQYKITVNLSKVQTGMCWFLATVLALICVIGPFHMSQIGFEYSPLQSAAYNAFSPIVWGIFLTWGVWAANNGCAGWFGDILSWKKFNIFTKIAYAVYLTQFPVFFYNVGSQRNAEYYKPTLMLNLIEMGFIIFVSAVLTIIVEIPFQKIYKLLFMNAIDNKSKHNINKTDDNDNMVNLKKKNTTKSL